MLLKNFTRTILIIVFLFSGIREASAYAIGDYGATTSGNWSTAAIWSTWNGVAWVGPGASGIPSSANNAFILSGKTVVLTVSGSSCQDLTVEVGAKLWTANSAVNVYLYVYGFNLVCDGQIGDGAIFDGISFGFEGANCTITGLGLFDASRMRKNTPTAATTNLTISRDVNLRFSTATTTMLYNAISNTNFNVTVNVGATVSLIASGANQGNVCIDDLTGTTANNCGGTFTINGTMNISGKLYLTTNNANPLYSCNWIVNGYIKVNEIVASSSGAATHSLVINSGGKIELFGPAAFSSIGTTNNTFTFNNGSTFEYSSSTGNQIVRVRAEFAAVPAALNGYYNLILSGTGFKFTLLTDLWVRNDLTITGSCILDPNPATSNIYVGGNWINYNANGYNEKTTIVNMNGSGLQTITCPGGEVYYSLKYAKTGSYLQFNNPVDVILQLIFVNNGYVDLNSNALTVRNMLPNGIQGQNANRYIVSEKTNNSSKIVWKINGNAATYIFPFGVPPGGAANYIPVVMVKMAATNIGDVSLATYATPPNNQPWPSTPTLVTNLQAFILMHNSPDNQHWTVDRFWEVHSTTPVAVDSMRFTYLQAELPDSDLNPLDLGAQFWNTTYWYNAQYGVPMAYNVSVPNFSIFNTAWTLSSLMSPLPIKLLHFDAIGEDKKVACKWATATEINNDYFKIEKSVDGNEFFEIGKVDGAGNSTTTLDYSFDDMHPTYGISYYRLKQTDYDGAFTYSETVPVNYNKRPGSYSIYPNPAKDRSYLLVNDNTRSEVTIRNVEGKLINSFLLDGSKQIYPVETSGLATGVYIVEIRSEYETQFLRMVKD